MKNCKKCNVELVKGTQYNSDALKGFNICKSCRSNRTAKHYIENKESYLEKSKTLYYSNPKKWKALNREWIVGKEDGLHHVYLLKNEYVGITKNLYHRMGIHKHFGNPKIACILHSTPDRENALELEGLLHDMGYKGKHLNNRYA